MIDVNIPTTNLVEDMLRESGWNVDCPVEFEHVRVEQRGRNWVYHLSLRCTGAAEISSQLLLKSQPGRDREALFYKGVMGLDLPIPRCFAARPGETSLVLMEDLSESHADACDWPDPIPQQTAQEVLDAVAHFHAAFWNKPKIGGNSVGLPDFLANREGYETFIGYLRRDFEIFATGLGATVHPAQMRLFQSVLTYLPQLWEEMWEPRLAVERALPLIHGDLNPCNILYPRQTGGRVVIVDWDAYRRGLAASDLSMLLGLHLCPQRDEVLDHLHTYHACLVHAGVSDYSFNNLLEDYQTALMFDLFYPIKLYSHSGIHDQTMLDNAILALESFSDMAG